MKMKPLSGGAIRDLAYISLCYGFLKVAVEIDEGSIPADGAIKRDSYRASKRLNRRMVDLAKRLEAVMQKYSHESKRVHTSMGKLFNHAMVGSIEAQLDYLGVFVYLLRFYERDKPSLEDVKAIREREINDLADLVGMTQAKESESEMYKIAYTLVELLR